MKPESLRAFLHELQEEPYTWPNRYIAWEKPNGTLFMIGTASNQHQEILKYQFESVYKDYSAHFVDINPKVSHMRGPHEYDPVEELVSEVRNYKYLGSWDDPDFFMSTPNGDVRAHGRWDLAKEKILNSVKQKEKTMSENNKIYLSANEDRSWSANIASEKASGKAVELCSEQTYPVEVYYARSDINGSSVVGRDICNDRESLLSSLNWIGKCCWTLLKVWDYDIDKEQSSELNKLFNDSYKARAEIMASAAKEMLEAFSEPLESKIKTASNKVKAQPSTTQDKESERLPF